MVPVMHTSKGAVKGEETERHWCSEKVYTATR